MPKPLQRGGVGGGREIVRVGPPGHDKGALALYDVLVLLDDDLVALAGRLVAEEAELELFLVGVFFSSSRLVCGCGRGRRSRSRRNVEVEQTRELRVQPAAQLPLGALVQASIGPGIRGGVPIITGGIMGMIK